MEPNPLREIRDIRRSISSECDDQPERVLDYYISRQEEMKTNGKYKFVSGPIRPAAMNTIADPVEQTETP